jgi:uncharacterized membrane protein
MSADDIQSLIQAIVRWIHVVAAILWVGQTYLFIFFEHNIVRRHEDAEDVSGSLWMMHGSGYYFLEKQGFSVSRPGTLHWFEWEAIITWLTGAILMGMIYYKESILIDMDEMVYATGAICGLSVIFGGFLLYSIILRTPIARSGTVMAAVGLIGVAAAHYGLLHVQSARSAFFHIGAAMGTIMAFNVVMGVIPAQNKNLKALAEGRDPDPKVNALTPMRAKHNSYMAIPLVFVMISNQYPTVSYGHQYSTCILTGVVAAGFAAAHWLRRR